MKFKDRIDGGERLAERLGDLERPLLLGLARGGLPVAVAAGKVLKAEFDVLVVRKAVRPGDREFGEGAVAPSGIVVGDASREEMDRARAEMRRRIDAYLDGRPAPEVERRLVVLVDDGFATGVTALAAIRYVRTLGPARVVVAVPVISCEAYEAVGREADEVVFVEMPEPFHAVGNSYERFEEVTDEEVRTLLRKEAEA